MLDLEVLLVLSMTLDDLVLRWGEYCWWEWEWECEDSRSINLIFLMLLWWHTIPPNFPSLLACKISIYDDPLFRIVQSCFLLSLILKLALLHSQSQPPSLPLPTGRALLVWEGWRAGMGQLLWFPRVPGENLSRPLFSLSELPECQSWGLRMNLNMRIC